MMPIVELNSISYRFGVPMIAVNPWTQKQKKATVKIPVFIFD